MHWPPRLQYWLYAYTCGHLTYAKASRNSFRAHNCIVLLAIIQPPPISLRSRSLCSFWLRSLHTGNQSSHRTLIKTRTTLQFPFKCRELFLCPSSYYASLSKFHQHEWPPLHDLHLFPHSPVASTHLLYNYYNISSQRFLVPLSLCLSIDRLEYSVLTPFYKLNIVVVDVLPICI